jgi:hypothetical protein
MSSSGAFVNRSMLPGGEEWREAIGQEPSGSMRASGKATLVSTPFTSGKI